MAFRTDAIDHVFNGAVQNLDNHDEQYRGHQECGLKEVGRQPERRRDRHEKDNDFKSKGFLTLPGIEKSRARVVISGHEARPAFEGLIGHGYLLFGLLPFGHPTLFCAAKESRKSGALSGWFLRPCLPSRFDFDLRHDRKPTRMLLMNVGLRFEKSCNSRFSRNALDVSGCK